MTYDDVIGGLRPSESFLPRRRNWRKLRVRQTRNSNGNSLSSCNALKRIKPPLIDPKNSKGTEMTFSFPFLMMTMT